MPTETPFNVVTPATEPSLFVATPGSKYRSSSNTE